MISKTAQADIEEMWERGLKPSFADIIRLNALALRRERGAKPDAEIFTLRRCAFLGEGDSQVVLREPCIGHDIWMDSIEPVVDLSSPETFFAVDVFMCGVDVHELPSPENRSSIREAVEAFLRRLSPFTRGQVAAAVLYCKAGTDPLAGEFAADREDEDDGDLPDQSFSVSLGIVRRGLALGIGVTLEEALKMPRRIFESMLETKCRYDGSIDIKKRESRLEDDYLRTLDEITARLVGDGNA